MENNDNFDIGERLILDYEAEETDGVREEWPEPVLFGELETPEIPTDYVPGFLGEYCRAVSESTQTPQGLAVMMGLAVVAACLQKRFEVAPYNDNYSEPLCLWLLTALEPGNRKTAVKGELIEPLVQWENEKASEIDAKARDINHLRDINLKRIEQLKAKASKPETTGTDREKCRQEISDIEKETPAPIYPPRLFTDDVTPERLQELMAEHDERMALLSDEGGQFEVMSGLYNNGHSNVNVFLQGHAGSPVRVDRQGRLTTLTKPALTFGLAVQPEVISDLSRGNKARFRGNGMLARYLYCMPKSNVGHRDVTQHKPIPTSLKIKYKAGIYELLNIPPLLDEQGCERTRILTLSPEALELWHAFSQYIESQQGTGGEFYSFQDWTAKLPGAALRIAGIFHVITHGKGNKVISSDTMEMSLDLCELLISHARAAFDLMGAEQTMTDAKILHSWIVRNRLHGFSQREALRKHEGRFRRVARLKAALDVLIERHIISEPVKTHADSFAPPPVCGRPSIQYQVNPLVFGGGAYGVA